MRLFNSLTKTKEEFVPIEPGKVKMYSCGPTVYGLIHIGNARPMVVFDSLRRYFEYKGMDVVYAQNYTDVDDKIIKAANAEGVSASVISERFIAESMRDEAGLNVKPHTFKPKVTEEMGEIIGMITELTAAGLAYEVEGSVYFDTSKFGKYGELSAKPLEELIAGARVEVDSGKANSTDFVLWKPAKPDEPSWESPWGAGRPGWHIECSAMTRKYLGETFDIHAGGEDLVFPHHENEIAQSESLSGKTMANYWLHNSFINVDNQKMAKSKGNFFTIRDISRKYPYDVIRFFIISAHYSMPVNFSEELMQAAANSLRRIKTCAANLVFLRGMAGGSVSDEERELMAQGARFRAEFEQALDNDFNTADAVTAIFELVRFANVHANGESSAEFTGWLLGELSELAGVLGLKLTEQEQDDGLVNTVEELVAKRQEARKAKDFGTADELRGKLAEMGVLLEDTPQGVRWSFQKNPSAGFF
ncbi:MAG: cysteine--tRNA ligase [Defluviitaleaceae bacterium]|nr:cysteine--tRNA ligase [Defluviitaleaceae bacterium]